MGENLSYKLRNPEVSCVLNPRSVGSCNLVLYEKDIPEIYQNFDSIPGVADRDLARAGSSVVLADYCPYVQVYTVKKRFASWDVTTKLSQGGNNDVITELFLPRGSLVSDIPAGDGKLVNLFFTVYILYGTL